MAGARQTNRRLRGIVLKGLLVCAATAGGIVLGATAASAEEGPLDGTVQDTVATVESVSGEAAASASGPTSPVEQPGESSVASGSSSAEAARQVVQESTSVGEGTGPVGAAGAIGGSEPATMDSSVAEDPVGAVGSAAEGQTSGAGGTLQQAEEAVTESTATAAPVQANAERSTRESVDAVARETTDATTEVTGATNDAANVVTESVTEPVTGTVAKTGIPSTESLTRDVDSRLDETVGTVTNITDDVVAAPTDLAGKLEEATVPVTDTTTALTSTLTDGLLTPVTSTTTALTSTLTDGLLTPVTSTATTVVGAAVTGRTLCPAEGLSGTGGAGFQSESASGSMSWPLEAGAVEAGSAVTHPDPGGASSSLALLNRIDGFLRSALQAWGVDAPASATSTGAGGTGSTGAPVPAPSPFSPWAPAPGSGWSLAGGGHGPAGSSIFWLLLAVTASLVVLRNGGLGQLAAGTSTVLAGRAALVQDRPG